MTSLKQRISEWNTKLDVYDMKLCRQSYLRAADWSTVRRMRTPKLYAGFLSRRLLQFKTHIGLALGTPTLRNIAHDVTQPMPIPDNSVEVYQSEDVFEHVPYDTLPAVFDEIYRVLKPGGLFRLSVPDYRCDVYVDRTIRDAAGNFLFDPGGGGSLVDGKVFDGHVWFPNYESVRALFDKSRFASQGSVKFLHYTTADGHFVVRDIDYSLGHIWRTPDHDPRVRSPRRPLSIVADARKAPEHPQ